MAVDTMPTVTGVTVDPGDAINLDDAIWVSKLAAGWLVTISVSDVAAHIPKGSALDTHAFTQECIHTKQARIIPADFAQEHLSLLPDTGPKQVLAFTMRLDSDFNVFQVKIDRAVLQHRGRFSYGEVEQILDNPEHERHWWWQDAYELAVGLVQKRHERGAITKILIEPNFKMIMEGQPLEDSNDNATYRSSVMIEELMILVNSQVASFLDAQGVSLIYWNKTIKGDDADRENVLAYLLHDTLHDNTWVSKRAHQEFHRQMADSHYSTVNYGHFGLGMPVYAHISSPIRRYADLVNQRIIRAWLMGEESPYSQEELESIAAAITAPQKKQPNIEEEHFISRLMHASLAELEDLSEEELSRLIVFAAEERIALTEAQCFMLSKKLESGVLDFIDMARVLFTSQERFRWKILQVHAMRYMEAQPHFLKKVFDAGASLFMCPEFSAMRIEHHRVRLDRLSQYEVRISCLHKDQEYRSEKRIRMNRRDAIEAGLYQLLMQFVGCDASTATIDLEQYFVVVSASESVEKLPNVNHVKSLGSLCDFAGLGSPTFLMGTLSDDGDTRFICAVSIQWKGRILIGNFVEETSEERAKERAAWDILQQFSFTQDPISAINSWSQKAGVSLPEYDFTVTTAGVLCTMYMPSQGKTWQGEGPSKQAAKREAAQKASYEFFLTE